MEIDKEVFLLKAALESLEKVADVFPVEDREKLIETAQTSLGSKLLVNSRLCRSKRPITRERQTIEKDRKRAIKERERKRAYNSYH